MRHCFTFLLLSSFLFIGLSWINGTEACSGGSKHWSEEDSVEDALKADASFMDVIRMEKKLEEINEKVDQIVLFLSHIYKGHEKKNSK